MLSKPLAFEQDKIALFLRNQEMHLHFSKLDSIKQRKNLYLPEIPSNKKSNIKTLRKNGSTPSLLKDKQYFIRRDNDIIFKILDNISKRPNQINNDSEVIDGYLNVKKFTRQRFRALKNNLLLKENIKIKERIAKTKPVIDIKQMDDEYEKSKKISGYLRKIHPSGSASNIYLNKKESDLIREYEREKIQYYMKGKEKGEMSGRKNVASSFDNAKHQPFLSNHKIDKKILGKIRYV
jgi:hypothetical protein